VSSTRQRYLPVCPLSRPNSHPDAVVDALESDSWPASCSPPPFLQASQLA
jgi:hypothetical protein